MSDNDSNFDGDFDLDARADLVTFRSGLVGDLKDNARYIYRMKSDAYEFVAGGFYGDFENPGLDVKNFSTNFCYLPQAAEKTLREMQEWDKDGKPFEIRYFWNFSRPTGIKSRLNSWLARLDIYFVRGKARRYIAVWLDSMKWIGFLETLEKWPHLVVMATQDGQAPDFLADWQTIDTTPFIFVGLENDATNAGLKDYLATLVEWRNMKEEKIAKSRTEIPRYTRKKKK